jgi:hypothetical protein
MAERMTDEQVRGLLDLCLSYPSGSDESMAPVRIGEVVSVFDEVLQLRAEVASLQRNAEWACQSPPPRCDCAGCAQARDHFSGEVDDG